MMSILLALFALSSVVNQNIKVIVWGFTGHVVCFRVTKKI